MRTRGERMLTTHTGSLPRPEALRGDDAQPVDDVTLREAVAGVVGQQVAAGVDIVGDGEFSKPSYATYVTDRLAGFGGMSTPFVSREMQRYPGVTMRLAADPLIARTLLTPACVDRLRYRGQSLVERDIANLLAAAKGVDAEEVFMTAASPGVIAWFYENRFYASHEDYVSALAEAMKWEYDAIHQAGIILQLDCPDLGLGFNGWRDQPAIDLQGHRRRMAVNIQALNHATRDIPAERMRLHVCWGNANAPHTGDVPLGDIIDVLLTARPAGLAWAAANPRHEHEWTVFEEVKLPDGKVLIPGVVDSTTNYVEHPELVAQRIGRYAGLVGWERVVAGSDCGFSSVVGLTPVDPQVAWEKLRVMADGARIASSAHRGA